MTDRRPPAQSSFTRFWLLLSIVLCAAALGFFDYFRFVRHSALAFLALALPAAAARITYLRRMYENPDSRSMAALGAALLVGLILIVEAVMVLVLLPFLHISSSIA